MTRRRQRVRASNPRGDDVNLRAGAQMLTAGWAHRSARAIWKANQAIARVPALNVLATNVELVAHATPSG